GRRGYSGGMAPDPTQALAKASRGRPGRPRKPVALKLLAGETRPSELAPPVEPDIGDTSPPTWMAADTKYLEVWQAIAPGLEAKGMLTHWDVEALARYCVAVVRYREAVRLIDAGELVVTNQRGQTAKNPMLQVERDQAMLATTLGARFGLTPGDRA